MKNPALLFLAIVTGIFVFDARPALPEKQSIFLTTENFRCRTARDTTLGDFYTVEVPLQNGMGITELHRAVLEFYSDVSVGNIEGITGESVLLEVYALTDSFKEPLDSKCFRRPSPMLANIPVGQRQRIQVDITEIVRYYLSRPGENYGLVIGSLTGLRDGVFVVREDIFPGRSPAKLTFVFEKP